MTKQKFDPKKFLAGKPRVYMPVPGAVNISRLYAWNDQRMEYVPPETGKPYVTRRWERADTGEKRRVTRYFETLKEAREWQAGYAPQEASLGTAAASLGAPEYDPVKDGPRFSEVVEDWKRREWPGMSMSTQVDYRKRLRLYFAPLMGIPILRITPVVIDDWIAGMKADVDRYKKGKMRKSFRHEFSVLSTVLHFYAEYDDDQNYVLPLKKRHREAIKVRNRIKEAPKDLTEAELLSAAAEMKRQPGTGGALSVAARVQFYHSRRISEAAAVRWEDCTIDLANPRKSRIRFSQHVVYLRDKDMDDFIEPGFKNSDGTDGLIDHSMHPKALEALMEIYKPGAKGLIFTNEAGTFFSYRQWQYAYDSAFRRAGLPYTSTHVMRHGGTRKVFDETGGDLEIAKQLLGNRDRKTVERYAKRSALALTTHTAGQWDLAEAAGGGRTRSQASAQLKIVEEI